MAANRRRCERVHRIRRSVGAGPRRGGKSVRCGIEHFDATRGPVNQHSTIALSLIAHTNAGKTTLARTLLGRDVGAVSDAQHVTQEAASYQLIETPEGDTLLLWDTPGFG